jgi:hypothetical protein
MNDEALAEQIVELLGKSMELLHQDFITLRNEFMLYKIEMEGLKYGIQGLNQHRDNSSKLFRAVIVALIAALSSLGVTLLNVILK